ncbi:MAG: FHA domain-containing protein [Gemmatales bacterium]
MKFSLVVISGTTTGKEIPIRMPEFVIGRDPECHLRPASAMISKKHCAFVIEGERVLFKDFGSTNGSFVNDARVEADVYLKDGDVVKFGPLTFRAKMQATAVMAAAPTVVPAAAKTIVEMAAPVTTASSSNAVRKASSAEDDIAAMLFNFADAPSGSIPADAIPMGSTVAGMSVDPTTIEQPALPGDDKKADPKKNTAKGAVANSAEYAERRRSDSTEVHETAPCLSPFQCRPPPKPLRGFLLPSLRAGYAS